ncbi:BadF/BadG/BcrA/BcrD ATPase family protein [Streptomyces sp. NPDC001292]|uniref:BadF/BadG/BcrA/BcrD ATPase family protein n=1 Tax=Streptomyces sp. NPDC001292 TaxID=3364558 RepID=UPI0036ABD7BF
MKAGTAQKLVLTTFSTAVMVRLGRTYSNLMVSLTAVNDKLRRRSVRLLCEAAAVDADAAGRALAAAGGDTRVALVGLLADLPADHARHLLERHGGSVKAVLSSTMNPTRVMTAVRVVGVDVGGTGVRVGIRELGSDAPALWTDRSAPAKIGTAGLDAAAVLEVVVPVLETLLADSATGMLGTADTIAVGATGFALLGGELRNRLPQTLADRFRARRVVLASDAVTAYAATIGTEPGAVIAAGTGAVALGLDPEIGWRRADGWGHLLGDDGGGAWIGREGLAAALRAYDGRPDGSPQLLDALVRRFGPPQQLPGLIQPSPQRAGLLASFAPAVAACARDGDARANSILVRAWRALAETAHAAAPTTPTRRSGAPASSSGSATRYSPRSRHGYANCAPAHALRHPTANHCTAPSAWPPRQLPAPGRCPRTTHCSHSPTSTTSTDERGSHDVPRPPAGPRGAQDGCPWPS